MGIPLPALSIRPPESPIEGLGKVMQLKNLAGQGQLQQAQLQNEQLDLEQKKMAIEDTKKVRQAYIDSNGDLGQTIDKASKLGVNPKMLIDLKNSQLDQQTKIQTLTKDQLANTKSKVDAIGAAAQSVLSLPEEIQPQAYLQKAKELQAAGYISPQEASQPFDRDMLKLHAAAAMSSKDQLDTELKKRDTAAAELKAQTEAMKLKAEMPGGALEDTGKAEMQDWLKKNPGKGPSDFLVWKAKNSPTFLQQALPAGANDPMVDMVGQNRIDYATAVQRMTPAAKAQFSKDLNAKYPNFNQAEFGVEKNVQTAFTSGQYSQQLNSINRAREHMGTFLQLAEANNNGDVKAINKVSNFFKTQFGSSAPGNLAIAKQAFASEVGKSFAGASVALADRQELDHSIDTASSWTQLRDAAKTADSLLAGAQKALKQTYESGRQGKPNFGEEKGGMQVGQSVTIKGKTLKVTAVHPDGSFDAE